MAVSSYHWQSHLHCSKLSKTLLSGLGLVGFCFVVGFVCVGFGSRFWGFFVRISSFTVSCFLVISLVSYGPTMHLVDPCDPFIGTAATVAAASISVSGDDTAAGRLVFM